VQLHRQLTEVAQQDPQNPNRAWELLEIHTEMQKQCWTMVTNQSWVNSAKQTKSTSFKQKHWTNIFVEKDTFYALKVHLSESSKKF